MFGSKITWASNDPAITVEGSTAKVNCGNTEKTVTLTATIAKGSSTVKNFEVQVQKEELTVAPVVREEHIDLPASFDNHAVSWSSSDAGVIAADGTVTQPESGYRAVVLTAEYNGTKEDFKVLVLPKGFGEAVYEEDYSGMVNDAAIAGAWTSVDKQNCLYVESDETHDSFIKFAGGNTGSSQGAKTLFGISDKVGETYAVTFDTALEAGTRETTEFALIGTDVRYKGDDTNAGLESGDIFKLSAASNSDNWAVNDSEGTFRLPYGWVHVTALVNQSSRKAAVIIEDKENLYYSGEVSINGKGVPEGLYLRWGCTQSLVSVDNVKVF